MRPQPGIQPEKYTAPPPIPSLPGSDWQDVPEGAEYTPEQAARRFLSMSWDQQVASMVHFREAAGVADACRMLGHEGAHIFATQHTCHDRYREGFEDGKQAVVDHMEKLADDMFGPDERMSP